jgi:four helix bundle protein
VSARQKSIKTFHDVDVYQHAYEAMLRVFNEILTKLPKEEQHDMKDQLRRSVKAVPRLIAEGHSKRHQKKGFKKYIDDAMAESNETIVSISQAKDLYPRHVDVKVCTDLIDDYDKISRQLYKLGFAWMEFNKKGRNRET